MKTNDRLLGIDLGTTAIKAAVFDKSGAIQDRFHENYPTTRRSEALVEQNPDDWVRLVRKALSNAAVSEISAIGLCSQVNTHVFVDANGDALCPAIVWKDRRANAEATSIDSKLTIKQKELSLVNLD